ncbi:DNA endonuclease SmrA [Glaciecola sp. KUL10]|jgi:DNA-nicking Smr family endonuclease|uniref:DNA endonuclease SmrA n=1 Tax=Glaciecola sp. (strain KUL10) TaxID=2161813 RepID=UPI000D784328|nr:DNA endonuclease SmrA [Glaciecola sp. KUL10]GBL04110.1 smr (small mutS related) domain containing protein [Glaciecola sp. KUL10]
MTTNASNDLDSFLAEMADVKPIETTNTVALNNKNKETLAQKLKRRALEKEIQQDDNGLSVDKVDPVDPHDFLSYKQDGVQEGVFKNLRLGKYQIDTHLMLNHLKFDEARQTLYQTLNDCHERGIRTVLIQHGIGLNSKPFPAFLKSYVNQWLKQIDIVIAYHSALKQHGGLGSVYVLLKKHPNQKLINRERNRKG